MKKWILLLLLMVLMVCPALAEEESEAALVPVAEGNRLKLYVTEDATSITVEDSETGMVWSSSMNDPTFEGKINKMWQAKLSSFLNLNYTNLQTGRGVINNMPLKTDKQLTSSYEKIENGARLCYDMGASQISLKVDVTIEDDTLLIRIPHEEISEYGDFALVSIDLMPFFFSASDWADGYFLYPDGCGAIMEFQDGAHLAEATTLYTVYGTPDQTDAMMEFFDQESAKTMLPVFGMARDGQAMVAIIEEGEETSRISLNCSNNIIRMNYLFANFYYRRGFKDMRTTDREVSIYDTERIDQDYSMRILFLDKDQSTYSDMANACRDYLLESGKLVRRDSRAAIAIDLFMTASEEGLIADIPRTVTTLDQAGEILEALNERGITEAEVSLKGWSKNGYGKTPDRFPMSGNIGGKDDLKKLTALAETLGDRVSLTVNVLQADADEHGYSHRNDVVYAGNKTILSNEDESTFLLSPDVAKTKAENILKEVKETGVSGIRYECMGEAIWFNYSDRRYTTASESQAIFLEMLKKTRDTLGSAGAEGGNGYLVSNVDMVTNVPYTDCGYQATTKSVPFWQMVMHGIVDYTATPGNLSSDLERETLRWIEMGYVPYFELTYSGTEELMYTDHQQLFSAQYTEWLDRLEQVWDIFSSEGIWSVRDRLMTGHEEVQEDVYRVTYEGGVTIYVNYTDEDVKVDGVKVNAAGYAVVEEGK